MQPCYAITSSHLDLLRDKGRGSKCTAIHASQNATAFSSATSARLYLIVRTLLHLCCVREEVASFLKHIKTKRKRAVYSSLVIVASVSVPPAEWQLLLTSYPAWSPGPLRVPWPCSIQRGETGAVKTHTSSPGPMGESSSSCCPTGLTAHSC